ncbi:MAG TPA: flagellar basal body rod protein FlgB [Anaerovoracaceae bacterium]|nr:flagellar basal body rod protein FlgB [Anaerovoracaceae bacterium]
MIGDSITSAILQKALDGTWQRQRAIANNIANHETPGYKAVRVSFEDSLNNEIQKFGDRIPSKEQITEGIDAIRDSEISIYSDRSTALRADGNNVDLDLENIEMAKTQIQYQFLTRSMTDMFARLRYAISEGKK